VKGVAKIKRNLNLQKKMNKTSPDSG